MNVYIQVIEHEDQRYETAGDWYQAELWGEDGGEVSIREHAHGDTSVISVSKLGDWRYEILVGVHELVELTLCKHAGISEQAVTAFDEEFEAARVQTSSGNGKFYFRGLVLPLDAEPGDHLDAPYYAQHQTATYIERLLARKLGVDWTAYEKALDEVGNASSSST